MSAVVPPAFCLTDGPGRIEVLRARARGRLMRQVFEARRQPETTMGAGGDLLFITHKKLLYKRSI